MSYVTKTFANLDQLEGLSGDLVKNHLTLYEGYVKNINKLNDRLIEIGKEGKYDSQEYAELNRRFGWEWNGMRLHELYFENMVQSGKMLDESSDLNSKIVAEFGSFDALIKDVTSLGAIRGIGWVVLYYDKTSNHLFNVWVNEHDAGHLAGATPLLVMDVFEHAYMLDYGTKKVDYIAAFQKLINWEEVEKRYNK